MGAKRTERERELRRKVEFYDRVISHKMGRVRKGRPQRVWMGTFAISAMPREHFLDFVERFYDAFPADHPLKPPTRSSGAER